MAIAVVDLNPRLIEQRRLSQTARASAMPQGGEFLLGQASSAILVRSGMRPNIPMRLLQKSLSYTIEILFGPDWNLCSVKHSWSPPKEVRDGV